ERVLRVPGGEGLPRLLARSRERNVREPEIAQALLSLLERCSGRSGLRYRREPEPLHGGFWAEIFAFELADPPRGFEGELVLRLMPDAARAKRESAVHALVAEAGLAPAR